MQQMYRLTRFFLQCSSLERASRSLAKTGFHFGVLVRVKHRFSENKVPRFLSLNSPLKKVPPRVPNGSQMAPIWHQVAPKGSQWAPKWRRRVPHGPQSGATGLQMAPQVGPKASQWHPKGRPGAPKVPQVAPMAILSPNG